VRATIKRLADHTIEAPCELDIHADALGNHAEPWARKPSFTYAMSSDVGDVLKVGQAGKRDHWWARFVREPCRCKGCPDRTFGHGGVPRRATEPTNPLCEKRVASSRAFT
jgi:hypothetical protein